MIMITPVEWRDYKSKKEVLSSFDSNEDFRVCCPIGEYSKWNTMACNKEDLINLGLKEAKIRYKNLTQTMIIKLEEEE